MYKITRILCIAIALLPMLCRGNSVQTPIVGIEILDQAGMHRELTYTVQFDYPLAGKECEYMLEQALPSSVFVSVDQLDDLQRLKKLNAIYPKFVDIELPTEKATGFTVLLRGTPKITDKSKLPIHFRYHAPRDQSDFVIVDVAKPTLYMNCPDADNELIDKELLRTTDVLYCLNENQSSFYKYDASIAAAAINNENCNWKLINVDYQLKSPLRANIPVGNEKAFPPVLYVTIILSWIVSIWTVFRTQSVPRKINHKLQEQRILQQKMK